MQFEMSSTRRLCGALSITIAMANLSGCGSSLDTSSHGTSPEMQAPLTEPKTSSDSSGSVVASVSNDDLLKTASALEIENAPTKVFSRDQESGALNVSFADLNLKAALGTESVTEEDVKRLPNWLKSLNGEKIRIRGYMLPTFEETGIDRFYLDHSPRMMNFGTNPKVYELMEVKLVTGTTTNYVSAGRSTEAIGIFRIDPQTEDGSMYRLYLLEDAVVVAPKPREGTR